jgi:hypothetical protein
MIRNIIVIALFFLSVNLYGQSAHYWTEAYGTRSMLLSGVVVGSSEDLGAVFYNPARISQFETPAFVISGQVYVLKGLTIKNGLGDNIDLNQSSFGGGPSMVSGTFKLGFLKGHHFAYAFLTRNESNFDYSFAFSKFGDFVNTFPGDEFYSGEIKISRRYKDNWMGLSWSYPINEKLSVGATGFYSNVEKSASLKYQLQAYDTLQKQTGMYIDKRAYSYKSQSILGKFGISYQGEKLTLGLTITTPKLEGIGSGNTSYETFLAGVDSTSFSTTGNIYIIDNQRDLESTSKSPFSIAIGSGIRLGKRSLLHLSAEYYAGIPAYTMIQSAPFTGQSTQEELQITVVEDLLPVINYGLGYEIYINENVSLFGSFATDFAAIDSEPDRISELESNFNNNTFTADIYHFGFGTDIKTKFADLTIGATYANSSEAVEREFSIDDGQDPVTKNAEIIFTRWQFLIGFQFHYGDQLKAKFENRKKKNKNKDKDKDKE